MLAGSGGRRFAAIVGELDIPGPFDLGLFLAKLVLRRQRMIFLHPFNSGPGIPCGMWIGTAEADHIFHEKGTTPWHKTHIITHEIAHMLLGHRGGTQASRDLARLLAPDADPALVTLVLGRSAYTTVEEQEAETLASLILEQGSAAPGPAPVVGADTAAVPWRCARRIPVRHTGFGMRAVISAAVAELFLILAWSAAIVVAASGRPVPQPVIAGVALAQGTVIIQFIAGATVAAWFPALEFISGQGRMWGAYWRLHPLWAILSRAAPDVQLPPQPGTQFNARYRLHRRVIEIRDAELALRPYWNREIAGQAADAARSARLPPARRDAVVEAAVIVTALDARLRGAPARHDDTLAGPAGPVPQNDLGAEAARLILVSDAIRSSPIVRSFGIRPGHV